MATIFVPVLKRLEDCADYSKTVEPFLPQLYTLPSRLLATGGSPSALKDVYAETNPLMSAFAASLVLGFVFLVVSEINKNYSQVDRMWSILPNLYVIHLAVWARVAGLPHARLDLVAAFTTLWSMRLTYNYWRKGGYNVGSEDYRWAIVKSRVPGIVWFVFNVTFISFIQSVLLFAFSCVPAYTILLSTQFEPSVTYADIGYFALELAVLLFETIGDEQQWRYQTVKHQYYKDQNIPMGYTRSTLDRGFLTTGLWAYTRHPNFLAEQSIWFFLYQWSCYASNTLYSWTIVGSASLILLFQGSTWLTEVITAGKYPEYKSYQQQVGMFIPKAMRPYEAPERKPRVIRTSELAKRQQEKEKQR
jgi:steroid 5-alpha reductase family enzyme